MGDAGAATVLELQAPIEHKRLWDLTGVGHVVWLPFAVGGLYALLGWWGLALVVLIFSVGALWLPSVLFWDASRTTHARCAIDDAGLTFLPERPGHCVVNPRRIPWQSIRGVERRVVEGPSGREYSGILRVGANDWIQFRSPFVVPVELWRQDALREAIRRHVEASRIESCALDAGPVPAEGIGRRLLMGLWGIVLSAVAACVLASWKTGSQTAFQPVVMWMLIFWMSPVFGIYPTSGPASRRATLGVSCAYVLALAPFVLLALVEAAWLFGFAPAHYLWTGGAVIGASLGLIAVVLADRVTWLAVAAIWILALCGFLAGHALASSLPL
jgi:hypothetical protein